MKTKEFIKRVEELGYEARKGPSTVTVRANDIRFAQVSRLVKDNLLLDTAAYALIKLCIEYAETPLEEREEQKKYRVQLSDPERVAVNIIALRKNDGKISLWGVSKTSFESDPSFHLTEYEIKRNHEYLWQFAKEVTE